MKIADVDTPSAPKAVPSLGHSRTGRRRCANEQDQFEPLAMSRRYGNGRKHGKAIKLAAVSDRSRAATVPLIAGRPVLELVNTVSWRGEPARSEDHLQDVSDCLTWATRVGVLTGGEAENLARGLKGHPAVAQALITGLRDLRTAVTETLVPPTTNPERVEPLIQEAVAHCHLIPGSTGTGSADYHWAVAELDEHTPRRRLALDLLELLTSPHRRIGVCADTRCQWAFLDTSHTQNRQWCSSEDCGNRHRVRRHQQRRTPSAGGGYGYER